MLALPLIPLDWLNMAWAAQRPLAQVFSSFVKPAAHTSLPNCQPQHAAAAQPASSSHSRAVLLRHAVRTDCTASGAVGSSSSTVPAGASSRQLASCSGVCAAASAAGGSSSNVQAEQDYSIAVPSYNRAQTLQQRTLASLYEAGVDCRSRVHVFVAHQEEQERYARALPRDMYAEIVVGKLGIGKQRQHIMGHFGEGANIIMLDDDIKRFMQVYDGPVDLHKAIIKGFELSQQHECCMWGINNSSNKFFMRQTYSTNWMFIQGPFMGFRVRQDMQLNPAHDDILEDVQYSLMHCHRDGKVLRINGIGLKASPYGKEPGGMQSVLVAAARDARVRANREYLIQRYGQYILRWVEGMPHPTIRRSKQHRVWDLQL